MARPSIEAVLTTIVRVSCDSMTDVSPRKLSALYYPYSRCVDSNTLKLLAILYDEIVFADPLDDIFREFLLSSDKGCQFVPSLPLSRGC